jgi:hypothetical protein
MAGTAPGTQRTRHSTMTYQLRVCQLHQKLFILLGSLRILRSTSSLHNIAEQSPIQVFDAH